MVIIYQLGIWQIYRTIKQNNENLFICLIFKGTQNWIVLIEIFFTTEGNVYYGETIYCDTKTEIVEIFNVLVTI